MKRSMAIILALLAVAAAPARGQPRETSHILVFGGPAFVLQRVDTVVSYTKVGSGLGGFGGAMLRYRWFSASLTYLRTRHTMDIRDIPVSLDFSDAILGLGCDLLTRGEVIPFAQACFGITSLTDMNSEGFTGGMTLGLGAGFRGRLPGRWGYLVNVMYGFNKYDTFESSAAWANRTDINGNHLLATAGLMYGIK